MVSCLRIIKRNTTVYPIFSVLNIVVLKTESFKIWKTHRHPRRMLVADFSLSTTEQLISGSSGYLSSQILN